MVSFVKPNLLGTRKEFTNTFVNPIQNGQCADSTELDVQLMKQRCHVLHKMLAGCVQVSSRSVKNKRKDLHSSSSRCRPPNVYVAAAVKVLIRFIYK